MGNHGVNLARKASGFKEWHIVGLASCLMAHCLRQLKAISVRKCGVAINSKDTKPMHGQHAQEQRKWKQAWLKFLCFLPARHVFYPNKAVRVGAREGFVKRLVRALH